MPAARLRAAVWQSIFTHDMRRYRRALYGRMGDVTTLITGASGTGKELVARAIGLSRYMPFDPETRLRSRPTGRARSAPINLSALSPTLIESELFGHAAARSPARSRTAPAGWRSAGRRARCSWTRSASSTRRSRSSCCASCRRARSSRLGETDGAAAFQGKIIAATNRDLADEMRAGRFRADFYYRLCSDVDRDAVAARAAGRPPRGPRRTSCGTSSGVARRPTGPGRSPARRRSSRCDEVVDWIGRHLGTDYPWPGNVRELEQCVRNVMIRGDYQPPARARRRGRASRSRRSSARCGRAA